MIDAVTTSPVQSTALRASPQNNAPSPVVSGGGISNSDFTSSRIRVDNLLDMAILEFRATETGDIIRQYPTESQIRAFQRASELDARQQQSTEQAAKQAQAQPQVTLQVSEPSSYTPQAPAAASSAPSPAAEGVSVSASSPSGSSYAPAAQGGSTQSVDV